MAVIRNYTDFGESIENKYKIGNYVDVVEDDGDDEDNSDDAF